MPATGYIAKIGLVFFAAVSVAAISPLRRDTPMFTQDEIRAIQAFWGQPGRHGSGFPPSAAQSGPYAPRQTAEGSKWLLDYFKARGNGGKILPTQNPAATTERQAVWDSWIEQRYTWDEWQARIRCWDLNQRETGRALPGPTMPDGQTPAQPGSIPDDLKALAGEPPAFVAAVTPKLYTTDFGDFVHTAGDNVAVRRKYAYYRFPAGIMDAGTPMKGDVKALEPLFAKAGVSDSQLRVMGAVSMLEGGFDSINTYDTGYVSAGFIQFASLSEGAGSLGAVLLDMKQNDPKAFQSDFRRFGLDVTPDGRLVALQLETGEERIGPAANAEIINNRRYASAFVRAGRLSQAFRMAQIRVAVDRYYPADDLVTVTVAGLPQTAKIRDFIKTEAGMATLMDRKVNTGKFGDLVPICESLAADYGLSDIKELAKLEFQIVRAMKYRKDYMDQAYTLSKPRDLGLTRSRGGDGRTPPPGKRGG